MVVTMNTLEEVTAAPSKEQRLSARMFCRAMGRLLRG